MTGEQLKARTCRLGGDSMCWIWIGRKTRAGYGRVGNPDQYAHRLMWALSNGPIPSGLVVMHVCDVPGCINPAHLRLGTSAENTADMMAKGRHRYLPFSGERNGRARLTPAQIPQIRALHAAGIGRYKIGRLYGTSHSTIGAILSGETWKSIGKETA